MIGISVIRYSVSASKCVRMETVRLTGTDQGVGGPVNDAPVLGVCCQMFEHTDPSADVPQGLAACYSFIVSLTENDRTTLSSAVFDLTREKSRADKFFDLLTRYEVTPCTLEDTADWFLNTP